MDLQDKLARYLIFDSENNAYYFRNAKGKTVFKHKEENHFLKWVRFMMPLINTTMKLKK